MRLRDCLLPACALLALVLVSTGSVWAAGTGVVVRDGDTIQIGDTTYKLDGIDAPEVDQMCIDNHADVWTCGIDARDLLSNLTNGRSVRCEDLGVDKAFKKRHIGLCTAEGDTLSLNQQLVRDGLALNAEASIKGQFKDDATAAKEASKGLWRGCFVAPQEYRLGKKDGVLLGGSCRADRDKEIRMVLFPEDLAMPPSCAIKAKFAVRARVTGNLGIYQLRGCPSYAATTKPDRWFCSEDDAQAAGFRKAFNCGANASKK
jgi:endonuclease YncB( thermonuclease family)